MTTLANTTSRRDFLGHAGAIGLGAAFLPFSSIISKAGSTKKTKIPEVPGLVFETFEAGGIAHFSFFIGDPISGKAVIIDPKRDIDDYIALAEKHRMKITHAIETHIHADFVSGSRELNARTGAAICASIEGGAEYGFPIQPLRNGTKIEVGNLRLQTIHTPGHTPEHVSFLASTRSKPKRFWGLFTGDFLFVGAVGRPDLMGVENTDALAHKLYDSLQTAYQDLPDSLPIFPAHGPGSPCGAGITEREGVPTLGMERESNPALQFEDRDAFIDSLLYHQPPVPYYWPSMKVINAKGPEILGPLRDPQELGPAEFHTLISDNQTDLLDTRDFMGFGGGHIAGAMNIGHSPSISMWGGWLLDPKRPLALVTPPQGAPHDVVAWLVRVGIEKFAGTLRGGMNAWTVAGRDFIKINQMSIHELNGQSQNDKSQIIDVRQPAEWDNGHVPNASYMFLPEIEKRMGELDQSKPVVVYCGTGYRGSIASSILKRANFKVSNVPGGFDAWLAAGHEVVVPESRGKASDTRRG